MADGFPVELARHATELQDRLELGGEQQLALALRVVERLDAQPVAREQNWRRRASQIANANMPRSRSTQCGPYSS